MTAPSTTVTKVKHRPMSDVPVQGFDMTSSESKEETYRDETVQERNRYALEHGIHPSNVPQCYQEHHSGNRGVCTRVGGDVSSHHTGMHYAGNEEYLVGAW